MTDRDATLRKPSTETDETGEWSRMVDPIVKRCELALTFGQHTEWDAAGTAAIGKLLKDMARLIDVEITKWERREEKSETWKSRLAECLIPAGLIMLASVTSNPVVQTTFLVAALIVPVVRGSTAAIIKEIRKSRDR